MIEGVEVGMRFFFGRVVVDVAMVVLLGAGNGTGEGDVSMVGGGGRGVLGSGC